MIKLFVKDNYTKDVHEVGTNTHDFLHIVNGGIQYYNLQNGCGTENGDYSFCNKDGVIPTKENTDFKWTGMVELEVLAYD